MKQVLRDLDLLYEVGSLRHISRAWTQLVGVRTATDLEHTVRVQFLALLLARMEGKPFDEALLLKMALVHDLAETRTNDHNYVHKLYVTLDEGMAATDALHDTTLSDLETVLRIYEEREVYEAQLVKDADNLDIDIELREMEYQGIQVAKMWREDGKTRMVIRADALHTNAARTVWDAIQESNPHGWHMRRNKFDKSTQGKK
jgi:putative hydrolase of HD superfamily